MDDRVGDILAQRARLDSGAGAAIFFSVLFHAALTAVAGWSAWHHGSTQSTPVMTIRFAQPQPAPEMTSVAPPPPVAVAVTPQPQPKPKAIEKKTAPPSPFGKSTKKAAEVAPVPQQPSNRATQQPAAAEVPVGGAGVTALEGGDFPYSLYIERMKTLIGSHWLRPQVGDTTAIIHFTVERDGTIRDADYEVKSGNGVYDRAALRAVLETSPLPPLPFGYNGTYLGVHLKFR